MATLAIIAVTVVGGGLGALGLYRVLRRGEGEAGNQDSDTAPAGDGSSSCRGGDSIPQAGEDGGTTEPRVPHDETTVTSSKNSVKVASGKLQSPTSPTLAERSGTPTSAGEATATKAVTTVEPGRQAVSASDSTGCTGADSRVEGVEMQEASTTRDTKRDSLAGQHAPLTLVSEDAKDTESFTSPPAASETKPPPVAPKPKQKSPAIAPKPKGRTGPPIAAAIAHSPPLVPVIVSPRPAFWGGASHSQEEGEEEAPVSFEEPVKAPGLKSPSRHKGPKRRPPSRLIEDRDSL